MKILRGTGAELDDWLLMLDRTRAETDLVTRREAAAIVDAVRRDGDQAVSRLLRTLDDVVISPDEILQQIEPASMENSPLLDAIRSAIDRIVRFHAPQRIDGYRLEREDSVLEHIVRPLRRVGIYVPGGRAVYLSSLIMCAVPARLAGVTDLVVATTPSVAAREEFRHVCGLFGIESVYRSGGAAGIAALALGTRSLARVDKIVGPGNGWVAAAKQLVSGEVGIDMAAGPSEIVVIADSAADPALVAADLRAQAEHGADSFAICITDSARFAAALARALGSSGPLPAVWIVVTPTLAEAVDVANRIAPEHLSILTRDPARLAALAPDCGAVFLGSPSAVALGDYVAGTNHVLPTGGTARFASPLGVYDFYKRSNLVALSKRTAGSIASAGKALAEFEGLPAHARSIELRERTS